MGHVSIRRITFQMTKLSFKRLGHGSPLPQSYPDLLFIAQHAACRRSVRLTFMSMNLANAQRTVGTPKYLANKMKSKGLQRLRWYCQVCEKQCRDENGFKCHAQSEAHLRQMLVVGENAGRHIADFSSQFQHDFVQLLSRRCVALFQTDTNF